MYKEVVGMRSTTGVGLCFILCILCIAYTYDLERFFFRFFTQSVAEEWKEWREEWRAVVVLHV